MKSKPIVLVMICLLLGVNQMSLSVPYKYWESNSVQSNGIRLHYWRTGTGDKPAMVLAHGITDFGLNWATLASKFESEFDIVMYDARGHGFSEKPQAPYDLATHVEDLVGLIKALKLEKPILMGHSMGGSIVMQTGVTYPDLARAVIMEDPPIEEMLENINDNMAEDWKKAVAEQARMPKAALMEIARTERHPGLDAFEYDLWAESKRLAVPEVIDILNGPGFGNPRELFPKLKVPSLILKADAKENLRKRHLEAAELLPNGRLIHIDETSHLVRKDKPKEVEEVIRAFISELE